MGYFIFIGLLVYCIFFLPWDISDSQLRNRARKNGDKWYFDASGNTRDTVTHKRVATQHGAKSIEQIIADCQKRNKEMEELHGTKKNNNTKQKGGRDYGIF